jgi:Carboxypeptidase regulatory-like domain
MKYAALVTAILALLLGSVSPVTAQTATGQITGAVRDASGGVISQAKVTVANDRTGFTRQGTTNESGAYTFALLPVGTYSVTAEAAGFQPAKRADINLNVDQVARIDLDLSVGSTKETVTVEASTLAVETETSTVGQVVNERQVTQLP